ncbi:unnamed protein product [Closterium sp. NIES-54]
MDTRSNTSTFASSIPNFPPSTSNPRKDMVLCMNLHFPKWHGNPAATMASTLVGARSPVASLSSPPAPPPFPWPVPPLWGGGDGRGGAGKGGVHGGSARGIGGHVQQLPRLPDNPTPQQLREWVVQRVSLGGSGRCLNVRRTGKLKGQPCGKLHTEYRFFGCLEDAWVDEYGNEVIVPNWLKLQGMGVDVYALDFVQINKAIYAMYVTELSDEGACYSCVPGDAGVAAAALGAIESVAALGASESSVAGASESSASAEALHTFTLDSGASRCFFRDCTTLTPLAALVPVSLADPTGGPVVARASTVLSCPAVPSGSLSGLHLPTFSTNLVSNAALHDVWVDTFTPRGQRVAICTCSRTGRHLATLTTTFAHVAESGQVIASSQVSASSQLAVSCSCWVLSHQTLLWHHRLDHPSLPRLRSMHSRLLVSGIPRSLPSLLRLPAPPYLPCVEGRQRAAPHSSEFPLTTAPLQTLHMDVWGPAPVGGMDQERYFLLVVDDYTRYTNVIPLRRKADVIGVLIPWIRATIRQLRDRFSRDLPLLRLHSDRGGEFSSDLLADFCRDEGIVQSFTLLASPQQNGIADRCIGLILEVARTSIIHAAAPHYLWPFVVRYAAHQLNLWPCVSLPETSPTLRWTGQRDFAAAYHLDYRASLVSDPGPACPPSVGGEVALGCDVLKDRHEELDCLAAAAPHLATMLLAHEGDPNALDIPTPRSYREANSGEYSSQWQIAMDAEMASWKSTGTYVDEDPPHGVNIISGMWIYRVKRLPGSPPAFKARYVARGFNQ